jgi:AcrR family transcriptional regulator
MREPGGTHSALDTRVASDTHAAITRAAAELMAIHGYGGTSMRDVARAVGMQMASLYYHFDSKQELLVHIMRVVMEELTAAVSTAIDAVDERDARGRLEAAIVAHVRFQVDRRPDVIVADSEMRALEPGTRPEIVALRDRHQALFRGAIEQGRAQGVLVTDQPGIVTNSIITMATDVALWFRDEGRLSPEDVAEAIVRFVMDGIGA